jgi:hypothetical protein
MDEFRIECEFGEMTQAYKNGTKFYVDYDNFINHVMGYSFMMNNGYVIYSSRKDGLNINFYTVSLWIVLKVWLLIT